MIKKEMISMKMIKRTFPALIVLMFVFLIGVFVGNTKNSLNERDFTISFISQIALLKKSEESSSLSATSTSSPPTSSSLAAKAKAALEKAASTAFENNVSSIITRAKSSSSKNLDLFSSETSSKVLPEQDINVDPGGDFLTRVEHFNDVLIEKHKQYILGIDDKQWEDIEHRLQLLWLMKGSSYIKLKIYTFVTTFHLKWHKDHNHMSSVDEHNILRLKYYNWSGTNEVCQLIRTHDGTKKHWDAVYNRSCNTDMTLTSKPVILEPLYFNTKPVIKQQSRLNVGIQKAHFYTPYQDDIFHIHKIDNAVFLENGDVLTHNLKVVPFTCNRVTKPIAPKGYRASPLYEQVFTISQFKGSEYYHSMLENIPRLAPYIKFLEAYPAIKIHCYNVTEHLVQNLEFLGLREDRLITGIVRAKIAYMPKSTNCLLAQAPKIQILNHLYISKIAKLYGPSSRSSVVLIRRSVHRMFLKNDEMTAEIRRIAEDFHRPFVLFTDNPVPSYEESMKIFYHAALVVGPHGAGLSNIIYSVPGIYVIEGVCNEPFMIMCYQWASHILGNRYHAIQSRRGCPKYIDIEPTAMGEAVKTFLQLIENENKRFSE